MSLLTLLISSGLYEAIYQLVQQVIAINHLQIFEMIETRSYFYVINNFIHLFMNYFYCLVFELEVIPYVVFLYFFELYNVMYLQIIIYCLNHQGLYWFCNKGHSISLVYFIIFYKYNLHYSKIQSAMLFVYFVNF